MKEVIWQEKRGKRVYTIYKEDCMINKSGEEMCFVKALGYTDLGCRAQVEFYCLYLCTNCDTEIPLRPVDVRHRPNTLCKPCTMALRRNEPDGSRHPLHTAWVNMKQRCNNINSPKYKYYGAKGIKVCKEWSEYVVFKEWSMATGWKPGLELDKDALSGKTKLYSPSTCQWISKANNRSLVQNRKLGPKEAIVVANFLKQGKSLRYIEGHFGVSYDAVQTCINHYGL